MSLKSRNIFTEIVGVLTLIVIIILILKINPAYLTRFTDGLYKLSDILKAETLYLWRERLFDTIFQAIAILVGLTGVLVLVLWGEQHD
jgi:hypothetical protein